MERMACSEGEEWREHRLPEDSCRHHDQTGSLGQPPGGGRPNPTPPEIISQNRRPEPPHMVGCSRGQREGGVHKPGLQERGKNGMKNGHFPGQEIPARPRGAR
jgi:hypothetical protein